MKRLGVIGTMVWDTIYGRGPHTEPVEEWGGIAYALAALEASLPSGWEIVPLIKVGRDLAERANVFLTSLTRRAAAVRFVEVPEPNNRVTLRYQSAERRSERMTGGVPGWSWAELGPMVRDLDAIYLNFISGFELSLETTRHLRHGFSGPIYADLHSLLLGVAADGTRVPQPLVDAASWLSCFDVVQVNEDEITLLGPEPMGVAAEALSIGVRLFVITLGERGSVYFTSHPFEFFHVRGDPRIQRPIQSARIDCAAYVTGDPTGCGDVFGGTLVSELLAGTELVAGLRRANQMAARNITHNGATNLHFHLRGEIAPR